MSRIVPRSFGGDPVAVGWRLPAELVVAINRIADESHKKRVMVAEELLTWAITEHDKEEAEAALSAKKAARK